MICVPCKKNKIHSRQGEIVERKTSEKLASAFNAGFDFLMQKTDKADNKTYKQRLSRCSHCDYLKRRQNLPKGADLSIKDSCLICGCVLKAKAAQIGESFECPLLWWAFENEMDFKAAFDEYQAKKSENDYNKILALIEEKTAENKKELGAIDEINHFFFEYTGGASRKDLIEFCEKSDIDFYFIGFYLSKMLNNKLIRLSFDDERKIDTFILIHSEEKD